MPKKHKFEIDLEKTTHTKQRTMTKINELLLNEIFEHFGVSDYDVVQIISREVWKKKYDGVMEQLLNKRRFITASMGDEDKFWKPEREVMNYGLGSIYVDESKEQKQIITRSQSRKYPKGHMYSIRSKDRGNVWITKDELDLYRRTKNAWARDTHNKSLWDEVWDDTTARTFLNSYYLSHFAKLFRIPKSERGWSGPDRNRWMYRSGRDWEKVWRFHRVEDAPKFLKV